MGLAPSVRASGEAAVFDQLSVTYSLHKVNVMLQNRRNYLIIQRGSLSETSSHRVLVPRRKIRVKERNAST